MGLASYNKRFLYAAVGAPGSKHDSRLLKNTRLYQQLSEGEIFPNKCLHLGYSGEIPLVTIGDSAFPQHSWLLKAYKEDTKVDKERYFNKKTMQCSSSNRELLRNAQRKMEDPLQKHRM